MTKRFEKELKTWFGGEILERAKELNLISRFTNAQAEKIENAARQVLDVAGDKTEQQRIVANLNLETSLLLCVWMMRAGQHVFNRNSRHKIDVFA